jgi:hypothetical protein
MFTLFVIVVFLPHHSHLTVEVFFPKKLSLLLGDVIYSGVLGYIVNYKKIPKTKNDFILTHLPNEFSDLVKRFWLFTILDTLFQLFVAPY